MGADFWSDQGRAQQVIKELNHQKDVVEGFKQLTLKQQETKDAYDIFVESEDEDFKELLLEEYRNLAEMYNQFEIKVLLGHKYDNSDAIIEIHPGAGGTESQDWASMLLRMYQRFADRHGFKSEMLAYQAGDEAGLKSASLLIKGPLAYGMLKAEKGVHRLVRISPFDSSGRRHTSFTSIEISPVIDQLDDIEIPESDIRMETHRASGAGGQHVNTTDSAVRLIHEPTGVVANCQNERSQHANREQALKMLKSKVVQLMLEQQAEEIADIKGDQLANEWGSQIRSYVFTPYTMVKDLRTNYEESDVESVMDGKIDNFIYEYLRQDLKE